MATLLEIEYGITTLRYADVDGLVVSGQAYRYRILEAPPLEESIGSLHRPRYHNPRKQLVLEENTRWPQDEQFLRLAAQGTLNSAVFRLLTGDTDDRADYTLQFTGRLNTPGGFSFTHNRCRIDLAPQAQEKFFGIPNTQLADDLAGIPEASAQLFTPRLFGDWTAAPERFIPTINLGNGQYVVGLPADIQSVAKARQRGQTADLAPGDFSYAGGIVTVTAAGWDNANDLVVTVRAYQDATYGVSGAGMARWLITQVMGEAANRIDQPSLTALQGQVSAIGCRAYFGQQAAGSQPKTLDVLYRLLDDLFYDLYLSAEGLYEFTPRSFTSVSITRTIDENDLRAQQQQPIQFLNRYDPDRVLANKLTVRYDYDPVARAFQDSLLHVDQASIQRIGQERPATIDCEYFYTSEGPSSLAALRSAVLSAEVQDLGVLLEGLDAVHPGELVHIDVDPFDNVPVQIRGRRLHLARRSTAIDGIVVAILSSRVFAPDAIMDWDQESDENKALYAFYTDEDGDDSQSKYAPGGSFVSRYADIADVVADTTRVTVGLFNQFRQNAENIRAGGFSVGDTGIRFVVIMEGGEPKTKLLAKANAPAEQITYDNADAVADFSPTDASGIGF